MEKMKHEAIPVEIRQILRCEGAGWSIFVGNQKKVFAILVEDNIGEIIDNYKRGIEKHRPLTHDLMSDVFTGFGITLERVIITDLREHTYYARMILRQNNELGRKIVEVDARPSDCIAMATAQGRPLFVNSQLFEKVDDMSATLEQFEQLNREAEDDVRS